MTYNTLYEKLVDQSGNTVQGYIAYGLYKNAKRQWIIKFKADNNRSPRPAEVSAFVNAYSTQQTLGTFETQAASILAKFADEAVEDAKPRIVEGALRGSFWGSVWQSVSANAIYTVILLVLVLILSVAGVDVLGIFEKIRGPAPAAVSAQPARPATSSK